MSPRSRVVSFGIDVAAASVWFAAFLVGVVDHVRGEDDAPLWWVVVAAAALVVFVTLAVVSGRRLVRGLEVGIEAARIMHPILSALADDPAASVTAMYTRSGDHIIAATCAHASPLTEEERRG